MYHKNRTKGWLKDVLRMILVGFILIFFSMSGIGLAQAQGPALAPLLVSESAEIIPDQYIVTYKAELLVTEADEAIRASVEAMGGRVLFMYGAALNGYSAILPAKALETVRADPAVEYVEADAVITLDGDDEKENYATQSWATWGLDRIDQRNLRSRQHTPTTTPAMECMRMSSTPVSAQHIRSSAHAPRRISTA